jgi:hypothetical protein
VGKRVYLERADLSCSVIPPLLNCISTRENLKVKVIKLCLKTYYVHIGSTRKDGDYKKYELRIRFSSVIMRRVVWYTLIDVSGDLTATINRAINIYHNTRSDILDDKGFGRKRSWPKVLSRYSPGGTEETMKILVMIASLRAEI